MPADLQKQFAPMKRHCGKVRRNTGRLWNASLPLSIPLQSMNPKRGYTSARRWKEFWVSHRKNIWQIRNCGVNSFIQMTASEYWAKQNISMPPVNHSFQNIAHSLAM